MFYREKVQASLLVKSIYYSITIIMNIDLICDLAHLAGYWGFETVCNGQFI